MAPFITYELPYEPAPGARVKDQDGDTWWRQPGFGWRPDDGLENFWQSPWTWGELLSENSPLTMEWHES